MYEVVFSDIALKQFKKIDHTIQERIICALERIRFRPEAFITKLVGDTAYKFRVGDYRVLLEVDKNKLLILVLKVGHRRNVYD